MLGRCKHITQRRCTNNPEHQNLSFLYTRESDRIGEGELALFSRKEKATEANVLVEERVEESKRERSFSQSELACKIENKQISSEIRKDNRGKEKGGSDDKLEKAKAFKLEQRSSLSSLKEKIDLRIQNASERRATSLRNPEMFCLIKTS